MVCRICGGEVDDPFWDEYCDECQHELSHDRGARFDPNCALCLSEAEDDFEYGLLETQDADV